VTREHRHQRIEDGVIGEIARMINTLAPGSGRILQIQPGRGRQTLLFRDQLATPGRPVSYDGEDAGDPAVSAATDFLQVDVEAAAFPAVDGDFDLVVWNRELGAPQAGLAGRGCHGSCFRETNPPVI
jgi:hypothetical protein